MPVWVVPLGAVVVSDLLLECLALAELVEKEGFVDVFPGGIFIPANVASQVMRKCSSFESPRNVNAIRSLMS